MLAYYVEWYLCEAWRELMLADTDRQAKVASYMLDDSTSAHSFQSLLEDLSTVVRNTCRTPQAGEDASTFEILTVFTAKQRRAPDLIDQIRA